MNSAFVALGSNQKNPLRQLILAIHNLEGLCDTHIEAVSTFYWTKFEGNAEEPDCLNAVAYLKTKLLPFVLFEQLQKIEVAQGRARSMHPGYVGRTLDLDLLLYNDLILNEKKLVLPHPRMLKRAFVMLPLAEIAPDFKLPNGLLVKDIANQLTWLGVAVPKHIQNLETARMAHLKEANF